MLLCLPMSPGDNWTIRRPIWTLRLEDSLVRLVLPFDIQRKDQRSRAHQFIQLQNQVNAFCTPVTLETANMLLVPGLHRAEVWSKLLMSRPTVTRNPFSKFVRRRHGRLETIWGRSYHLKRSYRPEARWLLCYGGKHLLPISSRHSLPYKLFLLTELAPRTIRTTSNLLTVLSCSTTKNRAELCSRTLYAIRTITGSRLQVCTISVLRPQPANPLRLAQNWDPLRVQVLNICFGMSKEAWIAHTTSSPPPTRASRSPLTCSTDSAPTPNVKRVSHYGFSCHLD